MKKILILIVFLNSAMSTFAISDSLIEVEYTAKLYCFIDRVNIIRNIDSLYVDSTYKFKTIPNIQGFDTLSVIFIRININTDLYKDEYYLAYIRGIDIVFRLQGFHENDFRRFMWFYSIISDPVRDKPYISSKKFARYHIVQGIDFYSLYKEWRKVKKSRFYFNSSKIEKLWKI